MKGTPANIEMFVPLRRVSSVRLYGSSNSVSSLWKRNLKGSLSPDLKLQVVLRTDHVGYLQRCVGNRYRMPLEDAIPSILMGEAAADTITKFANISTAAAISMTDGGRLRVTSRCPKLSNALFPRE